MAQHFPSIENDSLDRVVDSFRNRQGLFVRLFAILLALVLWQWYTVDQPDFMFPSLQAIGDAFYVQVTQDQLFSAFMRSMSALFLGFALAAVVGITIGLSMGLDDRIAMLLNPYVNALYVAPVSAMVPIIILIGGASYESRVFVVFLFVVFEIIVDTYEGVKSTPRGAVKVAESFGAGRLYVVRKVIFPHDLPYIFAGFRLGIGRGVKGMILAELLIEFANLGAIIRLWQERFRLAGVLSVVLLLMVTGIVLTMTVQRIGRRMIPWKEEVDL